VSQTALQSLIYELIAIGRAGVPQPLRDERHARWVSLFDWHVVSRAAPALPVDDARALLRGLVLQMRAGGPSEAAHTAATWLLRHLAERAPEVAASEVEWLDGDVVRA
jgi:hypothetical protein